MNVERHVIAAIVVLLDRALEHANLHDTRHKNEQKLREARRSDTMDIKSNEVCVFLNLLKVVSRQRRGGDISIRYAARFGVQLSDEAHERRQFGVILVDSHSDHS